MRMLLLEISDRNSTALGWHDESSVKNAIRSRLDFAPMLCFVGDGKISNRGFAIRSCGGRRGLRSVGMEEAVGGRNRLARSLCSCAELRTACTTDVNIEVTKYQACTWGLQGLKPLPCCFVFMSPLKGRPTRLLVAAIGRSEKADCRFLSTTRPHQNAAGGANRRVFARNDKVLPRQGN